MAHLAEQPAALPGVVVPVPVRDRPGGDPVHHQLRRRDAGERPPRGQHRGGPPAVEADRQLGAGLAPGLLDRVQLVLGQRQGLLAPDVPARGQGPRRQAGMRVVRGGDDHRLDARVGQQRVRAGHRLLEAVLLGHPAGGQAAGRGHRDELIEARGAERRQQRPGGERPGPGPADAGRRSSAAGSPCSRTESGAVCPGGVGRGRVGQPDGQVGLGAPLDQPVGGVGLARCRRCASPGPRPASRPPASRSSTASKLRPSVQRTWPAGKSTPHSS